MSRAAIRSETKRRAIHRGALARGAWAGLAWLLTASTVAAQAASVSPSAETPAEKKGSSSDDRRTLGRLPANVARTFVGVFDKDNLMPFAVGAAATGMASVFDDALRESHTGDWGGGIQTAGGPVYSSIFVVGMFTAGRIAKGSRFRAMTYDLLDASIINLGYTEGIKYAVGRERPNGQDNQSFPSGHTSNAFAIAAVAERHYGWKLGVPAYVLAGIVGASRIEQDKHWFSDVVGGAALGYIVGRTVVRVNSKPLPVPAAKPAASINVTPLLGPHAVGARMTVVF